MEGKDSNEMFDQRKKSSSSIDGLFEVFMKKAKAFLTGLLIIIFIVPVFYTLFVLGSFSKSPKIEVVNTVTDDAPVLKVAADFDFSPYSFYDDNNQISGLDVELINEIANRLGMKAEITFTDWITCKKMLQKKETDLILGLEIFSNLPGVLKTIAVSSDYLMVFGKNEINDISSLKDKRVGLITNSVIEKLYDLNCEYVPFYTNTDVIDAVEAGTIDYGICHGSVAKKILEKKKYDIVPSISLMNSYPAIGVRDDLPELRNKINNILNQLSEEGVLKKLDYKWLIKFTDNVTLMNVLHTEAKLYIIYFTLCFITICIVIVFMQDLYRKEMIMKNTMQYQVSLKKQNDILTSIANVYYTMHTINLTENTVKEIQSSPIVKKYVYKNEDASTQMMEVMRNTVVKEDVEMALSFTDLNTLSQRMENKKSILAEFRSIEKGWFCAQFIATEYNEAGEVTEVIFTIQSIDEMKKEKELLLQLSRYDELTRLLNRHAYYTKVEELKKEKMNDISVIVLDVNGLKTINDNIGHHAGDELICGAADCIREGFKNTGTSYRIGGDEFMVIVEGKKDTLESTITNFKSIMNNWKGTYIDNLSLSVGYASYNEIENFTLDNLDELVQIADKRMYEEKSSYYKNNGIERRR